MVNWTKSARFTEEITFLGHIPSLKGIQPDSRLTEKIWEIVPPSNKKELSSFLGIANFYRTKIPNFECVRERVYIDWAYVKNVGNI